MAFITLIGHPLGAAFLEKLAANLKRDGHDVATMVGESAESIGAERLAATEVCVPIAAACDARLLARMPRLRAIVSPLMGTDGIDVEAASERCVLVVRGATRENAFSMAEATFMLMLAALYDLPGSLAAGQGALRPQHAARRMLADRTVGILGYGEIAQAFVARLEGWSAPVLIHTRSVPATSPPHARFVGLDDLLREADVLVLLLSLNASTRHILSAERLARMKMDAVLVNTARGALIDEAALVSWLRDSPARRAALDVFETEPLPEASALRTLPNAILTPHCVGHTDNSAATAEHDMIRNIELVLAGKLPNATVNARIAEAWSTRAR